MDGNTLGLDEKELVTRHMYNQTAYKWALTSDGIGLDGKFLWKEAMKKFHRLAKHAPAKDGRQQLLEVGFGTGRDAKFFSTVYDYVGVDASEAFLEIAQLATSTLLNRDAFRLGSVYTLRNDFPAQSFDLFWSCATLLHCTKNRIQEALQSIRDVVVQDAVGFISLKKGDGEKPDYFDDLPRYFTYWQPEEFGRELSEAGFNILEFHEKPARTPFLCYFVQKA